LNKITRVFGVKRLFAAPASEFDMLPVQQEAQRHLGLWILPGSKYPKNESAMGQGL